MSLLQVADLSDMITNFAIERLDFAVPFVALIFKFCLLTNRFVKTHLQDAELLLVLLGGGFGFLQLLLQVFNERRILRASLFLRRVSRNLGDARHA
ncbi:hypothetical protein BJX68DRAFT_156723 [Aspergillus pseudodeflectus]|uniref:Uncharacterized protein n=1 Tax=Aspergillus pseudodeflectus TaxID=176178 RepID=A0ABR4JT70_9EURO